MRLATRLQRTSTLAISRGGEQITSEQKAATLRGVTADVKYVDSINESERQYRHWL
jgi:hypothetical protein